MIRNIAIALMLSAASAMGSALPAYLMPLPAFNAVGYYGGIPQRTNIFVNVLSTPNTRYQCKGDGVTSDSTAMANIITDFPFSAGGSVIDLRDLNNPSAVHIFELPNQLRIATTKNCTILGNGTNTILRMGGGYGINMGQDIFPWTVAAIPMTGGYTNGSTRLYFASNTGFTTGLPIWIEEDNDNIGVFSYGSGSGPGAISYNNYDRGNATANAGKANIFFQPMVTNVSGGGTIVDIWPPMLEDFNSGLNPRATQYGNTVSGFVFQDLKIVSTNPVTHTSAINCIKAHSCINLAITNVEMNGWSGNGSDCGALDAFWCTGLQVQHCYLHEPSGFNSSSSGFGYGMQIDGCTDFLIENNIVWYFQSGALFLEGSQDGVVSYNYFYNEHSGYVPGFVFGVVQMSHGPYGNRVLLEGNALGSIHADFYDGPDGTNVFIRNLITGEGPEITYNRYVMQFDSRSWGNVVVGNILGCLGTSPPTYAALPNKTITWTRSSAIPWVWAMNTNGFSDNGIFRFGMPFSGNNGFSGSAAPPDAAAGTGNANLGLYDLTVASNTWITANYDWATKSVTYNTNVDQNVPNSLYLSGKPWWFGNMAWPPFNATNGATYTVTSVSDALPAAHRFWVGSDPPPANLLPPVTNLVGHAVLGSATFQ